MDNRKLILIQPDGHWQLIPSAELPELQTLQDLVGGYIEPVDTMLGQNWTNKTGVEVMLLVNEEAKLLGLPRNDDATLISSLLITDSIVGPALVVGVRGEDIIALSDEAARIIANIWLSPNKEVPYVQSN